MIELLDVTLRDGGYTNGFRFELKDAIQIVADLHQAGIDWIEVGYRRGPEKGPVGLGLTAQTDNAYIRELRTQVPHARLVTMFHPHNISLQDLYEVKELGIGMVRICIRQDRFEQGLQKIREAKEIGLYTSANFVRVSYMSPIDLCDLMLAGEDAGADIVYFADSNGHMVPDQVKSFSSLFKKSLGIKIGFHAHNNLSLGLANTLAAIEEGVDIVDGSLRGMGRGAGNLATEVYVSYLDRMNQNNRFDVLGLLNAAECLEQNVMTDVPFLQLRDLLFGMANFSGDFVQPILKIAEENQVSWKHLAYELSKDRPFAPHQENIRTLARSIKKRVETAL